MNTFLIKNINQRKKNKTFREAIAQDNRQTGSNIGRIIKTEPNIKVYDLTLNTIISYTKVRLKELKVKNINYKNNKKRLSH